MAHNTFNTLKDFKPVGNKKGRLYSLPALAKTFPNVSRLPVSVQLVQQQQVLVQVQRLVLFYRKRPKQQQRSRQPKRGTCS